MRGKHLTLETKPADVVMAPDLLPLATIAGRHHVGVLHKALLRSHLGRPVYEVDYGDGHIHLFDARSGAQISPLPETDIRALAEAALKTPAPIKTLRKLSTNAPGDYRGDLPVWQVTFTDSAHLRLYIHPDTGAILARRTATWRLYDFLWGLHIMDYGARENFNNWLLRIVAALSLLMTGTGAALLITRYAPRRKNV